MPDLARVKALNPHAITVLYFNVVLDFPQYRLHHDLQAHPGSWPITIPNLLVPRMNGDSGPRMAPFDLATPPCGLGLSTPVSAP